MDTFYESKWLKCWIDCESVMNYFLFLTLSSELGVKTPKKCQFFHKISMILLDKMTFRLFPPPHFLLLLWTQFLRLLTENFCVTMPRHQSQSQHALIKIEKKIVLYDFIVVNESWYQCACCPSQIFFVARVAIEIETTHKIETFFVRFE